MGNIIYIKESDTQKDIKEIENLLYMARCVLFDGCKMSSNALALTIKAHYDILKKGLIL